MIRIARAVGVLLLVTIATLPVMMAAAPDRPDTASKAGEVQGTLDYCGPRGNDGVSVQIVGRSFQTILGAGGEFVLNYVPAGTYNLVFDIPGRSRFVLENVAVIERTISYLGVITVCRDADEDTYFEVDDCNDNNPNINPLADEVCDGYDNNCDAVVDEGCDLCTDTDNDGFFAQAGCLTQIDCDDASPTIRPNAVEECDEVDNNCNGSIDEGLDLTADPANCGSCGNVCSFQNSNAACVDSTCEMGSCSSGWGDCDVGSENGCETDLSADVANCGQCGAACDDGLFCTTDFCADGACLSQGLESDTCLIDGSCWVANEQNPASPCRSCKPWDDPYNWSGTALELEAVVPPVVCGDISDVVIRVIGIGFNTAAQVVIDGQPLHTVWQSEFELHVPLHELWPDLAPGTYDVYVDNGSGCMNLVAGGLTYDSLCL